MIELELPYPPSLNRYYKYVPDCPKPKISRNGRTYRRKICDLIAALGVEPIGGKLRVKVELYPPKGKVEGDADNYQKAMFDALQHSGVYANDRQIKDFRVIMCSKVQGGVALVRIGKMK